MEEIREIEISKQVWVYNMLFNDLEDTLGERIKSLPKDPKSGEENYYTNDIWLVKEALTMPYTLIARYFGEFIYIVVDEEGNIRIQQRSEIEYPKVVEERIFYDVMENHDREYIKDMILIHIGADKEL